MAAIVHQRSLRIDSELRFRSALELAQVSCSCFRGAAEELRGPLPRPGACLAELASPPASVAATAATPAAAAAVPARLPLRLRRPLLWLLPLLAVVDQARFSTD